MHLDVLRTVWLSCTPSDPSPIRYGNFFRSTACCLSLLLGAGWVTAQPTIDFARLPVTFSKPLGLVSAGDESDDIYILGKDGPVHRYNLTSQDTVMFLDLRERVETTGECGLLGAAFHPHPDSNYFYISYTVPGPDKKIPVRIELSRFAITPENTLDLSSERIVLSIDKPHYSQSGGGLAFGPDGYLYIGVGDGGGRDDEYDNGQNPRSLLGKILRIDVDRQEDGKAYGIPPDNPFVAATDTLNEIWSLGLRNPFRFSFDSQSGDFWITDKANSYWQEINFQPAGSPGGQNYGWNCREGFEEFPASSGRYCGNSAVVYDDPIFSYGRSEPSSIIGGSVTGGHVYHGPDTLMEGRYVFGDFFAQRLFLYDPGDSSPDSVRVVIDVPFLNLTTIGKDNRGELYAVDYGGGIFQIQSRVISAVTATAPTVPVRVYPNPTDREVFVSWPHAWTASTRAHLYSIDGRSLHQLTTAPASGATQQINLPQLPAGFYVLRISDGRSTGAAKFRVL